MRPSATERDGGRGPIDMDAHATTPLAPEAEAAMRPYWSASAANASSAHLRGETAAYAVAQARRDVADLIDAAPEEIVFTSGATEANALALLGLTEAAEIAGSTKRRIIASAVEHKSVQACGEELSRRGWDLQLCPVLSDGRVDLGRLRELLAHDTLLVSIMAAGNEVGVLQPIAEVAELAHAAGAVVHSDLTQLVGRLPFSVLAADVDVASLSAHKLHGPMGVGALYVSANTPLRPRPLMFGGAQEGGLRPGTLPVPLIVGFGAAARLVRERRLEERAHLDALINRLTLGLSQAGVAFTTNGSTEHRLPGTLSIRFAGIDGDDLLARCATVFCASTGSACNSGQVEPSRTLRAMGLTWDEARGSIRMGVTHYTTDADVDRVVASISGALTRLAA